MAENNSYNLQLSGLEDIEKVYVVAGVCRSGTTALEKLLTLGGVAAYHQPIKSAFKKGQTDIRLTKHLDQNPKPARIAIKETLGAYTVATSTFNPLDTIRSSIPDNVLHSVFTVKEPFNNFLSWISMAEVAPPKAVGPLTTEELLGNYILSSQTLFNVFRESIDAGIPTTIFDYESLKNANPATITQQLLVELDIDPRAYSQQAWTATGSVRDEASGVIHLGARATDALHDRLDASQGFQYFPPNTQLLPAESHDAVRDQLHDAGLYTAYDQMIAYAV